MHWQGRDLYHTCMVVFPNLCEEWTPFVYLIVGNIGTVLETYDKRIAFPCFLW